MTNNQLAIPFNELNSATGQFAEAAFPDDGGHAGQSGPLESERMGLLSTSGSNAGRGAGLEEWIASNLDLDAELARVPRNIWNRIVEGLPGLKRAPKKAAANGAAETRNEGWPRFHVGYKRGITLVRLRDSALLKESMIQEFACDLTIHSPSRPGMTMSPTPKASARSSARSSRMSW